MSLEVKIFETLHGLTGHSALLDRLIVFLGNYSAYLLILLVLYWLWREENWRRRFYNFALVSLAALLSRGILTPVIRALQPRPRPFEVMNFLPLINHEAAAALPSGHAAFFFALAFAIYFMGYRRRGAILFVAALVMGTARVAAGIHWPLDIVAGMLVGLAGAFVVKSLLPGTLTEK